jgi:hypothetical protein
MHYCAHWRLSALTDILVRLLASWCTHWRLRIVRSLASWCTHWRLGARWRLGALIGVLIRSLAFAERLGALAGVLVRSLASWCARWRLTALTGVLVLSPLQCLGALATRATQCGIKKTSTNGAGETIFSTKHSAE